MDRANRTTDVSADLLTLLELQRLEIESEDTRERSQEDGLTWRDPYKINWCRNTG
jgi:hypothetical protein